MEKSELLKRLEAIRCWNAPNAAAVNTVNAELDSLIEEIKEEETKDNDR